MVVFVIQVVIEEVDALLAVFLLRIRVLFLVVAFHAKTAFAKCADLLLASGADAPAFVLVRFVLVYEGFIFPTVHAELFVFMFKDFARGDFRHSGIAYIFEFREHV